MKMKTTYMEVLEFIHDHPGCSVSQIATALGLSYNSVKRIVDDEYANLRIAKSPIDKHSSNMDVWGLYIVGM